MEIAGNELIDVDRACRSNRAEIGGECAICSFAEYCDLRCSKARNDGDAPSDGAHKVLWAMLPEMAMAGLSAEQTVDTGQEPRSKMRRIRATPIGGRTRD